MNIQSNPRFVSLFKFLSEGASVAVFAVGIVVLVGWMLDIPTLKSVHPCLVTMKANTAAAFVLIGVSLWLLQTKRADKRTHHLLAQGCAILVALAGLLTLSEYLFGWDLGIDQLLFKEPIGAVLTTYPGRMAPNTALNFLLIGTTLMLLDVETRRGYRPAQFLILIEGMISLLAFAGYLYGVSTLYSAITRYTAMALHTAVAFIVVCVAIQFARPDRGLMTIFTSEGVGGTMARRLLFAAIAIPLTLDIVTLAGERVGLYDSAMKSAMAAVLVIGVFALMVFITSRLLERTDVERKRAEEELRKYSEHLEELVEERTAKLKKINEQLQLEIFERKRAEEELRKANRAIKTLSECNQVLVRATDESVLLHDICRVIVETGEYRMAMVGYAEQDKQKTVRAVAQMGYEENFLKTVNLTWADTEQGHGPLGTAIRTRAPSIFQDIPNESKIASWREAALKRGYASAIGLPLIADSDLLGALAIYSVETYAFDEEEIKLLTELADDLAYGITVLRTRAEREQAEEALQKSEARL